MTDQLDAGVIQCDARLAVVQPGHGLAARTRPFEHDGANDAESLPYL